MSEAEYQPSKSEACFAQNKIREILHPYKQKVIDRGIRDTLLLRSPSPISGCTSVSLPYLLECLSASIPALYPYKAPLALREKQIFLVPTQEVFASIDHGKPQALEHYCGADSVDIFSYNENYGREWAYYALLRKLGLSDAQIHTAEIFDFVIEHTSWLISEEKPVEKIKIELRESYILKANQILSQYGFSFTEYAKLARRTGGVQVLYKDTQAVRDFFENNLYSVTDDYTFELRTPIPLEHIAGFVPLGEHEESIML